MFHSGWDVVVFRSMRSRIAVAVTAVIGAMLVSAGYAVYLTLAQTSQLPAPLSPAKPWSFAIGGALLIALLILTWIFVVPRHTMSQLHKLREAANSFADDQLATVVEQLRRGETVDLQHAVVPVDFGADEFGDVGRAINHLGRSGIQATVDASAVNNLRNVLGGVARRLQTPVSRQLQILEMLEQRDDIDPDVLTQLYELDHAASQQRRATENLIILAGSTPGRRFHQAMPMLEVIHGASETAEHTRVHVVSVQAPAYLAGRAVTDVMHLLAELVENGIRFSPPHTRVRITAEPVSTGFVVEIEDRGLGLSEEELERYNERLSQPTGSTVLTEITQVGLFVVGRLARRHGITVTLRSSPFGGVSVIVLIPEDLFERNDRAAAELTGGTAPAQPVRSSVTPG